MSLDIDAVDSIISSLENLKKEMEEREKSSNGDKVWNDLMQASKEISRRWEGQSALEEIKDQRGA
jgi:Cu/Ag efflux pump CusA